MIRYKRADGSKAPIQSNTHIMLNKQYDMIVTKIKVNEEDLAVLSDSVDDTDSEWLRVIVSEQKRLYKDMEYIEDKIAELNNYNG